MKRVFEIGFSRMLSIFAVGTVVGILGCILVYEIKDTPTSNPRSVFRDYFLHMARISYLIDVGVFAQEYTDNKLAANRKYKGETVYIKGFVKEFSDGSGEVVVYLDLGNSGESDAVKSIACQMRKRMLPILINRKKGERIDIVGEVVGLVSADSLIYLKNCLAAPREGEFYSSQ